MAKAHLYTTVKVARDEDLMEQIGRDKYFDLVDHNKVRSFRIKRQMPFNLFKVGHLREATDKVKVAELNLFLEVELGQGLRPIPPPVKNADDILLFFKLYDPLKEELSYVGRLYVKAGGMPVEILAKINRGVPLLERILNIHKDTYTNFSMKDENLQTVLLESFAAFIETMSTTKVYEVQEEVLRRATVSVKDFEQVGLELSWMKKRLETAKKVNKCTESRIYVDLCETALKVGRAKVRELEEGLVKAKTELEDWSTDLPNSLAANDYLLMDVV
ncbi:hypothetical protein RHGRI_014967 [Rhododendron griersonianum]|uniref:Ubiquitin carboxyl-terminal hydrolase 7 ICP0-binding domain-containing protein n=1 Tax=Rhododendron griersonianum TaxID=479676 RepID=A0AAV6KC05_9ERIC|nr:hypothetical protein RHGRI_014967 [Rhododendron griersonianum]